MHRGFSTLLDLNGLFWRGYRIAFHRTGSPLGGRARSRSGRPLHQNGDERYHGQNSHWIGVLCSPSTERIPRHAQRFSPGDTGRLEGHLFDYGKHPESDWHRLNSWLDGALRCSLPAAHRSEGRERSPP